VAGCYEHGSEPLGYIKCAEFLDLLRNCCLLMQDSAPFG
jgi:hypothetical protein